MTFEAEDPADLNLEETGNDRGRPSDAGLNPSITPPSLPSQPQIVMVIEDFQAVQARQVQVKQAGEL